MKSFFSLTYSHVAQSMGFLFFFSAAAFSGGQGAKQTQPDPLKLLCTQSFLKEAYSLYVAQTSSAYSPTLGHTIALEALAQGRMSPTQAAYETSHSSFHILFESKLISAIIKVHFEDEGFWEEEALKNALLEFNRRTSHSKLVFVDRIVLSLIETLGPSLYSTDPRSDKIRRMLENDFQISKWATRDFQDIWQQVVAHHFLDLRAYILHLLEAPPKNLLKQVVTPRSFKSKVLRLIGLAFKPKLIDQDKIPELLSSPSQIVDSSEESCFKEGVACLKTLSLHGAAYLIVHYLDHLHPADLEAAKAILAQSPQEHAAVLSKIDKRLALLERERMRWQDLKERAKASHVENVHTQLETIKGEILPLLAELKKTADLTEFSVEIKSEIERIQHAFSLEIKEFKVQDHSALSEAGISLTNLQKRLTQVSEATAELKAKMEEKQDLDYQISSLTRWIDGYQTRESEKPRDIEMETTGDRIRSLLHQESDFARIKLAEDLLLSLLRMDLPAEDKKKLVLRICLHLSNDEQGIQDWYELIYAFLLVQRYTVLDSLRVERIEEIYRRVSNKLNHPDVRDLEDSAAGELLDFGFWDGKKESEQQLIRKMETRLAELKTTLSQEDQVAQALRKLLGLVAIHD